MPVLFDTLKRRWRPRSLIRDLEIRELIQHGLVFQEELRATRAQIAPADFKWYPWDSFGTLSTLDKLLTGRGRFLQGLIGDDPVLDLGCGDGDLSFFFESLGCQVCAVDNPSSNFNRMQGVKALKGALGSSLRVDAADLDGGFEWPVVTCGLAIFLGVLYHLKNPFGILEGLAARARYCILSTAITRYAPDQQTCVRDFPVAFLAGRDGLRGDETNYWIFSEAGLRVLLERTGWKVCDWMVAGDESSVLWGTQRDERVFCLLESRALPPSGRPQLCDGWHVLENDAWRWTERRFSVAAGGAARSLTLRCTLPQNLSVPVTLSARARGVAIGTHAFTAHGDADCVFDIPAGDGDVVEFELDHALMPDTRDGRERGIVVRGVEVE